MKKKSGGGVMYVPGPLTVPAKCYRCGKVVGHSITKLLDHYAKKHPEIDLSK